LGLLSLLIQQGVSGAETGLDFMQPAEFIKLLFVILLAKIALDLNEVRGMNIELNSAWLFKFSLLLLFALLAILPILLSVSDYSPLLIIFTQLYAYYWLVVRHPIKPNQPFIWGARLVVIPIAVSSVLLLLFFDAMPQGERIQVWLDPWADPDAGYQLRQSLAHIHEGGWFGAGGIEGWFGSNGSIMNIGAIQDDFILAFLLYKFGGIMALFLLFLQMTWLGLQFWLFKRLFKTLPIPREERLPQILLAYILYGLLWMQAIHWLISWGNVLGLTPIMGQPMIWLSSGRSYLLAVALPSALLTFVALRLVSKTKKGSN
jgi:cell division protein FtsW (lipid II flippase)